LKKRIGTILLMIVKASAAAILWMVGFGITSDLSSHSLFSLIMPIYIMIALICGIILCNSNWRHSLFTWFISVLFFSFVLIPAMVELPDTVYNDEFVFYIGVVVIIFSYIIAYAISTLTSTFIAMLVYKFIQKKFRHKGDD
jgi:hypothetical protein